MSDCILFLTGDYEAPKFCQKCYTPSMIQSQIYRQFVYSYLIADSVIIPAGCYFESEYTTNLVDKYHSLFLPHRNERPVAGLAIGEDRESFLDDVAIKASWYPKAYNFSDTMRAIELSKRISDLEPVKRAGKMRNHLTENILQDIAPTGRSFQIVHCSERTDEETMNILKPLEIIVSEQKFALLPPYTRMEMDKQRGNVDKRTQKTWLDFVLFKNYVVSCEAAYEAYSNNPLSFWYGDLFKSVYSFHVDYRDTLLFERFFQNFPLNELKNIENLPAERLFEIKYSDKFIRYLSCYKKIITRVQESLSTYILDQNYKEISQVIDHERRVEKAEYKRRIATENAFDATVLYSVLNKTFQSQTQRVKAFKKWLENQDIDLPVIQIMEVLDDKGHGIWASFIEELALITKERHKEMAKSMSKNTMINIFSPGSEMANNNGIDSKKRVSPADRLSRSGTTTNKDVDIDAPGKPGDRRFAVALSFPGEYRYFVKKVSDVLCGEYGKDRVLYDEYHRAEFSRVNLDLHLQQLYAKQSELVVVFLCKEYEDKSWCGLELRAIRSTLLTDKKNSHRIMPVKIGPGDVDGFWGTIDGFLPAEYMTEAEVAEAIIERYNML